MAPVARGVETIESVDRKICDDVEVGGVDDEDAAVVGEGQSRLRRGGLGGAVRCGGLGGLVRRAVCVGRRASREQGEGETRGQRGDDGSGEWFHEHRSTR